MSEELLQCNLCTEYITPGAVHYKNSNGVVCYTCGKQLKDMADDLELVNQNETYKHNENCGTPIDIKRFLDKRVVGQEAPKKILSVAVYNHYKRIKHPDAGIEKSNVLLVGDSGTGKTYIAKCIAEYLGVPFVIVDATTFTQAGYVGEDIESMLTRLYIKSGKNKQLTEKGVIFIDEVDKLAAKPTLGRDATGEGVQQGLLKFLEGTTVTTPTELGKNPTEAKVQIDTKNILFICSGSFPGMQSADEQSLLEYGIIPELIGRLPIIAKLHPLDVEHLVEILKLKGGIVDQYKKLFDLDGITLNVNDDAYEKIAIRAIDSGLGARQLRRILEKILQPYMYSMPGSKRKTLRLTGESI